MGLFNRLIGAARFPVGGEVFKLPPMPLASLQALGSSDGVAVGDVAWVSDYGRVAECLTVAPTTSTWGYRWQYTLSAMQSTSSISSAERWSCWRLPNALGSSLGNTGYQRYHFRWPTTVYGIRYLNGSDPGNTTIKIYDSGNATPVYSNTFAPGADTWATLTPAPALEFSALDYMELSVTPTNARVAFEKNECLVDLVETVTLV